jgi:hypothetical protein
MGPTEWTGTWAWLDLVTQDEMSRLPVRAQAELACLNAVNGAANTAGTSPSR